jgi:ABC-type phosphate/phosphonate transport system substrate-binding protein
MTASRVAAFGMYDHLPETRAATDALWAAIASELRAEGMAGVPDVVDRARPWDEALRDPSLVLGQICGYPLVHALFGRVRVVMTPCHAIADGARGDYRSVVVVRDASSFACVEDLRGAVVALNDHASHSGKHALGALVAALVNPVENADAFFRRVVVTGSHLDSVAAVARGDADVAAVDCITHALFARHTPRALHGTRVLAETPSAPAPPFVTRAAADQAEIACLRAALSRALSAPALGAARDALLLGSVRVLDERAYDRILELERAHGPLRIFP